jgi:hypothetical protein
MLLRPKPPKRPEGGCDGHFRQDLARQYTTPCIGEANDGGGYSSERVWIVFYKHILLKKESHTWRHTVVVRGRVVVVVAVVVVVVFVFVVVFVVDVDGVDEASIVGVAPPPPSTPRY